MHKYMPFVWLDMPRNSHEVVVLVYVVRKSEVMKTQGFHKIGFALATAMVVAFSTNTFAQDTAVQTPAPMASTAPATTYLSQPASEVLQLSQAKISDSTIITYVQNSGTIYGLNASQIVYLKQQGVSDNVINAMLNQRTLIASSPAAQPPTQYPGTATTAVPTATVAQPTSPAPSVYVVPDTQTYDYNNWSSPYYSYPYPYYYGWYGWPVGVYWGWGGGHGGYYGGWHGGYGGGWHGGGGGFHGGGGFGGGFHGGGGGGFHH